jgi:glutaryl-CoA dehydrogenase
MSVKQSRSHGSAGPSWGGAGITLDYPPLRHANNLESVLTYEGTSEIHSLAIGQTLTGLSSYR